MLVRLRCRFSCLVCTSLTKKHMSCCAALCCPAPQQCLAKQPMQQQQASGGISSEVLAEKERTIAELKETNEVRQQLFSALHTVVVYMASCCGALHAVVQHTLAVQTLMCCQHKRGLSVTSSLSDSSWPHPVLSCTMMCVDPGDQGPQAGAAGQAEGCQDPDAGGKAAGSGPGMSNAWVSLTAHAPDRRLAVQLRV